MVSMKDKVCLVTGATSGIGYEMALGLAQMNATVVGVGRDPRRSREAAERIRRESGNPEVEFLLANLSVQEQIHRLADQFLSAYAHLDVLINNAGALFMTRRESADGIEMTFALNHLGYFLLTMLLLDRLKASAPSRIINVASEAHRGAKIDFEDLQEQRSYNGWRAYNQSKLANLLFTYELARRLEGTGVTVNALHPGLVATKFGANNGPLGRIVRPLANIVSISPREGAKTGLYLASSPDVKNVTGKYFYRLKEIPSSGESYDEMAAIRLWNLSTRMTRMQEEVASY